ncbi:histidine phosphotranseferase [Fusarium langsethiae]|uniref:Histidine phosphotranseferase n=1 Tax=Fusarium langsethiae TaxID=179993 RepID=A0A0M9ENQ1_FUSLA|nr:histidine phosphotranseferase [Fusarium langsethiae]
MYRIQFQDSEPIERQNTPLIGSKHRILLLGATGVGKSSFIARTARCDAKIGHSMVSCTTHCAPYDVSESGSIFTLIDTPGFNDTTKDNMEILRTVTDYLDTCSEYPLTGIIYLHRITDTRVCGADFLNLQMLKALAGQHFYSRVVVTSTMWDTIPNEELDQACQRRETALKNSEKYWRDMIEGGCKYFRFRGDQESGLQILRHFLSSQSREPPAIIAQLNERRPFEKTDAGYILVEDRRRREHARLKELEEARDEEAMSLRSDQQLIAQNHAYAASGYPRESTYGRDADRNAHYNGHQQYHEPKENIFARFWLFVFNVRHPHRLATSAKTLRTRY